MTSRVSRATGALDRIRRRTIWTLTVSAVGIAVAATSPSAGAACSLNVQGVIFGTYDTFSASNLDSTGNIAVTCDLGTSYTVSLSPGTGTYASRRLASGGDVLSYNLFVDPTRQVIWGDGTGGTFTVSGAGITTAVNYTVYGRIPSGQNASVGNYSDSITVTVTF
jgi:spore coat protein U-like protein